MHNVARVLADKFIQIQFSQFLNHGKVRVSFTMDVETFDIPREKILNTNYELTTWDNIKSGLLFATALLLLLGGDALKFVFAYYFKYI